MTESLPRRSALVDLADAMQQGSGSGVSLRELSFLQQVELRGDPGDPVFLGAFRQALGLDLPLAPNSTTEAVGRTALWLGPDNWLTVEPEGAGSDLVAKLAPALAGLHAAMVDVSAARAILELTGAHARAVLQKGCGLDLHPRAFTPGSCAGTHLARAQVLLMQRDRAPTYWIFVRPSFGPYLVAWLLDAMAEFRAS
jgi:sarcosine oxidase, subunit gamma